MRVVVIGGTGLIGRQVVRLLAAQGHDAVAASPTTGVNTITRIGLDAALAGAHVVVDVGDAPSFDDEPVLEYFLTSGHNLARAELASGVAHHVTLSIVAADRLPNSGYMRAKVAQEAVTQSVGVPYSILRSTQTFELMRTLADNDTVGDLVRTSPALAQPVAAHDIAEALADVVAEAPSGATHELAGPEPLRLVDLVDTFLRAQHDARRVEAAPEVTYYGSRLDDRTLMPGPEARHGATYFADWLRRVVGHQVATPR